MPILCVYHPTGEALSSANIRRKKGSYTHLKSKEPKVSALQTHLYPSRCENPVVSWMKAQLHLRANVHLRRTIIRNYPKCAGPGSVILPGVCKNVQRFFFVKDRANRDPGAWFVTVLLAMVGGPPLCVCLLESEPRTSSKVSRILCGRGMTGFLHSNDTGLHRITAWT